MGSPVGGGPDEFTLNANCCDCESFGFTTRIVQLPVALRVIRIRNELAVTFWICPVPWSVAIPPFGKVTFTLRPFWKLLPFTITFWSAPPAIGTDGLIEPMLGFVPDPTVNPNGLDCPPSGLLIRIVQFPAAFNVARMMNEDEVTF
ncbi:MAG TPA: hypothetical protein PKD24_16145 [Pyrinomonadaceae bacterium]|nr:hypothetical protein [Pyrinomonadaceae bacterium]HMP66916.1 hypothetical protein [Pyrinomonadaceae bacterium]